MGIKEGSKSDAVFSKLFVNIAAQRVTAFLRHQKDGKGNNV